MDIGSIDVIGVIIVVNSSDISGIMVGRMRTRQKTASHKGGIEIRKEFN